MEPLNSKFFIFKANQENPFPFVRDWHPYENWLELPRPRVELANVRKKFPAYFWVTASGTMTTTVEVYQRTEDQYIYQFSAPSLIDERVQQVNRDYGRYTSRIIPHEKGWDGSDFFNIEYERSFGEINCTRRFVELAHQEQWDNICFLQLDNLRPRGTDFRSLPWPPELWYPQYQPKDPL